MRGEGNHKIPGSFAPENMEKTGAERVKYSLACQHEDAIPIKFVSYAQKCPTVLCTFAVALRKESVDRNQNMLGIHRAKGTVALRKESVDRNSKVVTSFDSRNRSLSARRAWIEMLKCWLWITHPQKVALRKESVDRNIPGTAGPGQQAVALRKESVDRNGTIRGTLWECKRSLSARRAWIEIR